MPSTKRRPFSWIGAQSRSPRRRLNAISSWSLSAWSRISSTECSCHASTRRANAAASRSLRSAPRNSAASAAPVGITSTAPVAARRMDAVSVLSVMVFSRFRRRAHSQSIALHARPATDAPRPLLCCGCRAPAVAQLEVQVARVDEHTEALAEDEDRIADIERIAEQQQPAADREEPERDRHHHLSRALGCDPLHHKAHGEHDLRHIAEQYPPLEFGYENVVQVVADRLREINQHSLSPPRPAARDGGGGSATRLPRDRGCRPTTDPT